MKYRGGELLGIEGPHFAGIVYCTTMNLYMIPFFSQRIGYMDSATALQGPNIYAKRTKLSIDYMKMFYVDEANIPADAVRLSLSFFGADHVVWGTDYPYGPALTQTVDYLDQIGLSQADQKKILETNIKTLLNLK